jgi:HK97 family phage major capsid protein
MDRITALKARRQAGLDEMDALLALAGAEERDLTAEEQARFDALRAEDDRLAAQLAREDDMERRRAAAARPVASLPGVTRPTVPAQAAERLEPGVMFARITQALIQGNMDQRAAAHWAEQAWGSEGGQIVANLEQSTNTKGGFLVDTAYSRDFIDLLRPRVAVRARGARSVPMPEGNLTIRRKTAGTQASYIGERTNIPTTGVTVGQNAMSAKRLAALVPITNQLLRRASLDVDMMVRDDLREGVAVTEDQQFLRGTGSATAPAGLLHLANAANKIAASATADLQSVRNDLGRLVLALVNANIPMVTPGYIISPRTRMFLENLLDGNGNRAFPEVLEGRIGRYPYSETTSVPDNLGAATDESEIYFADFAQVMIADTYQVTIAASDVASYNDGTETRSAFQTDETLIRIITEHDTGVRYDKAIAVLQQVKWAS